MDVKLTLIFIVLMVLATQDLVRAEFGFNRVFPKQDELEKLGLKCIPGRTVIKIQEKPLNLHGSGNDDYEDYDDDGRRHHTRFQTDDEHCQMCVCSIEAKDEHCFNRPAKNVNECMRMAMLLEQSHSNVAFDHQRSLSDMIRRDLIWHNDEIPYNANAKCKRAHSYYTNNINANDTDIEGDSDYVPKNLLGYMDSNVCFYCVCSITGQEAGCISRSPVICDYFIKLKANPTGEPRDRYRNLFQQDRPAFFRQLSYRLRRTMDKGMYDYIETGGDSLCCGHSDGHRRQIHSQVKNKIRSLRKKLNKENLLSNAGTADYVDFIVNNDK